MTKTEILVYIAEKLSADQLMELRKQIQAEVIKQLKIKTS